MRTYSRQDLDRSRELWSDFSSEWEPYRRLAAERGMLYPPNGTKLDSWADDEPSQRALLIRAIRETPTLLRQAILRSSSWSEVIGKLNRQRDEWAELDELEITHRRRDRDTPSQAVQSLASILDRIRDSAA